MLALDGGRDTAHCALQRHRYPTEAWTLQQLREAIPSDHAHRFLIRDRDAILSTEVQQQLKAFRVRVLHTPRVSVKGERLL
jgi:hypothetical protein